MNAGTPPAPGASHLTIETYRVRPDGERLDRTPLIVYRPGEVPPRHRHPTLAPVPLPALPDR
ncbi:hypothetical protein AB0D49_34255 [Streptomyces sp. NPDC048290]|uniref:hypothetical protein n=1 Tax=Streptomyces sp. NPDC048290 TaxID=3155811 RepID=UPI003436D538